MTTATTSTQRHDLVPLADRLRYMQAFRLGAAVLLLAGWLTVPAVREQPAPLLAGVTLLYLGLSLAAEVTWRAVRRRGLALFGAMLIVDGVYLAWLTGVTGGPDSPIHGLVVLHVIAVALLGSFRSGMKLALWHSLLALIVLYAGEAGFVPSADPEAAAVGGPAFRLLIVQTLILWAVAIATATFAAVNERELRRRRYDLEALARLAYRLETTTDPHAVADALVEAVVDDFGFQRALLVATPDDVLSVLSHRGLPPSAFDPAPDDWDSVLSQAEANRETLRVARLDPGRDPWLDGLMPGCRNVMVVPLHAESRTVGFLIVEHGLRAGSRIERRVVSTVERFASQSALALDNAWLLEQVQRLAASDGLTGLPNRRQLDEALGREIGRAQRTGQELSLIMLDIDRFKRLNDTHGHQAGDDVLRAVAARLEDVSRAGELVARYGGEEFTIVLPGTGPGAALIAAERLRRAVEGLEDPLPVTASLGVATYPANAVDGQALVEAADRALYESKRSGRNRTTVSDGAADSKLP